MANNDLKNEVTCRTCLTEVDKNDTLSVYSVKEIIMSCSTVQISELDGLPSYICNNCHATARKAYEFWIQCDTSDKELRRRLLEQIEPKIVIKEEIIEDTSLPEEDDGEESEPKLVKNFLRQSNKRDLWKKSIIYKCEKCEKSFANSKRLNIHLKNTHNRLGGHLCSICGKQFTLPENYIRHQKIHTGEKRYKCTLCEKSFVQSGELKSHMVSHTLEKSFLCSFCGNKFGRKPALRAHIRRLHSNPIRSHMCNVCGKSFKDKQDLVQHKRIHTEERQHLCKECGKAFNRKSNLTVHERTHNGHRPHICNICQRGFIQKHVLNTHMQKIHPI